MKVGLIDVDGHNFPNIPLMKLSAWHKQNGDRVEWYDPMFGGYYDRVYMSKVFTFTPDYEYCVDAGEIIRGGTGYSYPDGGASLPDKIEHIYPDYSIYYDRIPEVRTTAYGFLSRGCPRGCPFCIVGKKEGCKAVKVANLDEFWRGQKNITLLDPNMFACREWRELSRQLIESRAWIDFSQGCDIRIMTDEKTDALRKMRIKQIHFAWDRYAEKDMVLPKFQRFKEMTGWDKGKMTVYVLCGYDSTIEQDLERVYTLRDMGYSPYIMIYDKHSRKSGDDLIRMQRWVNSRYIFAVVKKFEDYK